MSESLVDLLEEEEERLSLVKTTSCSCSSSTVARVLQCSIHTCSSTQPRTVTARRMVRYRQERERDRPADDVYRVFWTFRQTNLSADNNSTQDSRLHCLVWNMSVLLFIDQQWTAVEACDDVIVGGAMIDDPLTARDIRISNQFLITRALHFAQPQAYYHWQWRRYRGGEGGRPPPWQPFCYAPLCTKWWI